MRHGHARTKKEDLMKMIKSTVRPLVMGMAISMMVFATPLLGSSAIANASEQNQPRINITGVGRVDVAPDMATLSLGVVREHRTAKKALLDNNIAMNQVIASMKDAGIDPKHLQTSNFSIQPRYVHSRPKNGEEQKPPRIVGYVVSNNLTVRIMDLQEVGAVIDRAVAMGVNMGGNISFGNAETKTVLNEARALAMKDAMERANILLGAAGAELGPIIEINETSRQPRPLPMARGRMMAESMAADQVPIEGGENTYEVSVSVSWQIRQ